MKAYLYGRHSTAKQSATEDVQRAACERYFEFTLKPKGVKLAGWHYDAAVSGGKAFADRPNGLEVWLRAEKGDYIIVSHLDRAFRSLIDGSNCCHALRHRGVHFVALDLGLDTSTPMGEFALHIFLSAAQMQRRYIAERTSEVVRSRIAKGHRHGQGKANAPIGWKNNGSGLVEAPDEREQVRLLVEMRDSGLSVPRIEQIISRPHMRDKFVRRYGKAKRWTPRYIRLAYLAHDQGYPRSFLHSRPRMRAAAHKPD
jgi:DNA invertase Pin-like site-specific DNA recombinase